MTTVAIMQPYLFPYIGYFQLIASVDEFVVLDDVNYIKAGWINRNTIELDAKEHRFTVPVEGASQNRRINEHKRAPDPKAVANILATLKAAYSGAPEYDRNIGWVSEMFCQETLDLTDYLETAMRAVCGHVEIKTRFLRSSEIAIDPGKTGQERILALAKTRGAAIYHNPIGGTELYDKEFFSRNGIELKFLRTRGTPRFSILHGVFTRSSDELKRDLREFDLV